MVFAAKDQSQQIERIRSIFQEPKKTSKLTYCILYTLVYSLLRSICNNFFSEYLNNDWKREVSNSLESISCQAHLTTDESLIARNLPQIIDKSIQKFVVSSIKSWTSLNKTVLCQALLLKSNEMRSTFSTNMTYSNEHIDLWILIECKHAFSMFRFKSFWKEHQWRSLTIKQTMMYPVEQFWLDGRINRWKKWIFDDGFSN